LLAEGNQPSLFIQLYGRGDAAAAGWGSKLGAAVRILKLARVAERRRQSQDFGRV
jgi:hypothetical protein